LRPASHRAAEDARWSQRPGWVVPRPGVVPEQGTGGPKARVGPIEGRGGPRGKDHPLGWDILQCMRLCM